MNRLKTLYYDKIIYKIIHKSEYPLPLNIIMISENILITDTLNNRIYLISPEGKIIGILGDNLKLDSPIGIAYGRGFLYIADSDKHRILKIRYSDGQIIDTTKKDCCLKYPSGLLLVGGRLYITDTENNRVVVINPKTLQFLFSFGNRGPNSTRLCNPYGITMYKDNIFIADSTYGRIQVFTYQCHCNFVRTIGRKGTAPGEFNDPYDIMIIHNMLFVTEWNDGKRIQILTMDGNPLQVFYLSKNVSPLSICGDDKNIYVTDTDGDIHKLIYY